jgi:hypothetical protein
MFQIFLVVQFVLMFLFCPETTYLRDLRYETDVVVDEKLDELAKMEEQHKEVVLGIEPANIPKKKTFVQELAVYTGVYVSIGVKSFSYSAQFVDFLLKRCFNSPNIILSSNR